MIQIYILFITLLTQTKAVDLNINFRFSPEVEKRLMTFAEEITKEYNFTNEINFTICAPHITMYLTTFNDTQLNDLVIDFAKSVEGMRGCYVTMKELYASGDYFMWRADNTDCLQKLSNKVVRMTSKYRNTSYEIPDWVYNLPDGPEKTKKLAYCKLFGSPNVFDGFDPHFTLIVSTQSPELLSTIAKEINSGVSKVKLPTFEDLRSTSLSMAVSGPFGTVLRDQIKGWTNVYEPMMSFFDDDEVIIENDL